MKNYKDILISTAVKAGDEIMKYFGTEYSISKKRDSSPVTEADIAANNIIVNELQKTGIPILSEESYICDYNERKNWKIFWIIDPLDGTKQFVKNENEFTVNIALVVQNKVVEGVVYIPVTKLLYYGETNYGAVKIDFKISSQEHNLKSSRKNNSNLIVIASKSHLTKPTIDYLENIKQSNPEVEIFNIGSSLKFCSVAEGKADLYPRIGSISEWDIAAGHAVLKSVGGNVIDMHTKNEIEYNSEGLRTPDFIAYLEEDKLEKILKL